VLTLLGGDLVLEPLAFEVGLHLLALDGCGSLAVLGFGRVFARGPFGLGLGLLEPALPFQRLIAGGRAGNLLRFAEQLPDDPAGGPLAVL
jgi:hypothetical protein